MSLLAKEDVFSVYGREMQVHLRTYGGSYAVEIETLYQAFKARMLSEMKADSVGDEALPDFHPV